MNGLQPIPREGANLGPDGERFVWGPVIAIHEIGDFSIVESRADYSRTFGVTDPENHGRPTFHLYLRGRSMGLSAFSLDEAIVHGVARKYDGANTRAGGYFWRIVGHDPHEDYERFGR